MFVQTKKSRVTAVDGKYQIGVYTLRPIAEGEEVTFDYNSVTEVSTIPGSLKLHIKLLYLMFM
jgi:SET domain-containing protein